MSENKNFNFNVSLSVLDHLGRNLYRSFITVIGEAISNSWDANAKNVWITINKEENYFIIKDDGNGMSEKDFQNKFLKIGYTKRSDNSVERKGRPFIGGKGIGKLALLSCAEKISIITKRDDLNYVGAVIDNSKLDKDITDGVDVQESKLGTINESHDIFKNHIKKHKQGTIIHFEGIKDGIKNRLEYISESIALSFRFSLIDPDFNIFVNEKKNYS
jgi:DNA topoisomerase VI subunit B